MSARAGRRCLAAASACALVLAGAALAFALLRGREVLVYYTASLDGHLDGCTCFGYPTAGLVKTGRFLRARDRKASVLLDAGDVYEAGPNAFLAREIKEAYAELGFDAVAPGEQEFSNGIEAFRAEASGGFFRAQNLQIDGSPAGPDSPVLLERGDMKILVLSLTGEESFVLYPPEFRARLRFRAPDELIEGSLASRPDADFAILLYHGSAAAAEALALGHPGLSAVIVGHEKKLLPGGSRESREGAQSVGRSGAPVGAASAGAAPAGSAAGSARVYSPGEDGNRVGILRLRRSFFGDRKLDNRLVLFDYIKDADDAATRARVMRYNDYFVKTTGLQRDVEASPGSGASGVFEFSYFYDPSCRSCLDFLGKTLPRVSTATSTLIRAHKRNIQDLSELASLDVELAKRGLSAGAFPVVISSGSVLQGEKEIVGKFEALVRHERLASFSP